MTDTLTGTCRLCGESFGRGISSHVKSCITDHANQASLHHGLLLGVRASGLAGRFWMYLLLQPESSLRDLDGFFREIWLDDDATPSLFDIEQEQYLSTIDPEQEDEAPMASMDRPVGSVLRPRMEFDYLFDPEDPTELECRVFDPYPCPAKLLEDDEDAIVLIVARNERPEITCSTCERTADAVCLTCLERSRRDDQQDDQQDKEDRQQQDEQEAAEQPQQESQQEQQDEQASDDEQTQKETVDYWVCETCRDEHEGPFAAIENSPRLHTDDV